MDPLTTIDPDTDPDIASTIDDTDNKNKNTTWLTKNYKYLLGTFAFVILLIAALILDLVLAPVKDAGVNDIVLDLRDTVPRADIEFTLDYGSFFSTVEPREMQCTLDSGRVDFAVSPSIMERTCKNDPPRYHVTADCPEEDVESHAALIWDLMTKNNATTSSSSSNSNNNDDETLMTSLMDNGTCEMKVRVRLGHILPYTHTVKMPLRKLVEMGEDQQEKVQDEEDDEDEATSPFAVHVCHMDVQRLDLCLPLDLPSSTTKASLPSTIRLQLPALRLDAQPTYTEGMTISMDAFEASFDPNKEKDEEGDDDDNNVAVFSLSSTNHRQSGAPLPFYRPLIDLFMADVDESKVVITLDGEGSFLEILLGRDHEFFIRHYEQDVEEFHNNQKKQQQQEQQDLHRRRHRHLHTTTGEQEDTITSTTTRTSSSRASSSAAAADTSTALVVNQRRAEQTFEETYQNAAAHCLRVNDNSAAFDFGLCWLLEVPDKTLTIVGNAVFYDTGVTGVSEATWLTADQYVKIDMTAVMAVAGQTGLMDVIGGIEFDWLVNTALQFDLSLANIGTLWPFVGRIKTSGSIGDSTLDMTIDEVTLTQGTKGMDVGTGSLVVNVPPNEQELYFDFEVTKDDAYLMDIHASLETDGTNQEDVIVWTNSSWLWDSEYVWDLKSSFSLDWADDVTVDAGTSYVYMIAGIYEAVSDFNATLSGSLEADEEDDIVISGELTHRVEDIISMQIGLLFDNSSFAMETSSNCTWNGEDIWIAGVSLFLESDVDKIEGSFMEVGISEEVSEFDFSIANFAARRDNDDLTLNTTILHSDTDEITLDIAFLFNEDVNFELQATSHCFWNEADVWDSELVVSIDSETSADELDTTSFLGVELTESVNDFTMSMSTYAMRDGEEGLNDDLYLNSTIVFNDDDLVTLNLSLLFNEPGVLIVLMGSTTGFWDQADLWIAGGTFTFDWSDVTSMGQITGNADESVSDFTMSAVIDFQNVTVFLIDVKDMSIMVADVVQADTTGQFIVDSDNSKVMLDMQDVGRIDFIADVDFISYDTGDVSGSKLENALITRISTGETVLDGTFTTEAVEEGAEDSDRAENKFVLDFMMPMAGKQLEVDARSFYDEMTDRYTAQITHFRNSQDGVPSVDFTARLREGFADTSLELSASDAADYDFATNFTLSAYEAEDESTVGLDLERVLLRAGSDTFVDMWMAMTMEQAVNDDFTMAMTSSSTEASDLQMDMDMSISWFEADEALMMTSDKMILAWRDTSFVEMPMELSDPIIAAPTPAPTPVPTAASTTASTTKETVTGQTQDSSAPSPSPVDSSTTTSPPTVAADVTYVFPDINVTMQGMPALTPASRAAFETGTAAYYTDLYQQPVISRLLRHHRRELQAGSVVSSFETVVTVTGEDPDENGNTITYDQTIKYIAAPDSTTNQEQAARDLIVAPLSTADDREQYLTFLADRDDDFAQVTEVDAPEVPVIVTPDEPSGEGDGDGEGSEDGEGDGDGAGSEDGEEESGVGHAWTFGVVVWSILGAMLSLM